MRAVPASVFGVAVGVVATLAVPRPEPALPEVVTEVFVREVEVPCESEPVDVLVAPEDLSEVQLEAWHALARLGRAHEWECMAEIFAAESSWRPNVVGDLDRGGSYGLPQRHAPSHGKPDLPWPVAEQVEWAVEYADERYGGMCEAAEARRAQGWW